MEGLLSTGPTLPSLLANPGKKLVNMFTCMQLSTANSLTAVSQDIMLALLASRKKLSSPACDREQEGAQTDKRTQTDKQTDRQTDRDIVEEGGVT